MTEIRSSGTTEIGSDERMAASAIAPAVFEAYFDDAAVFPPGLAPLEQAVTDHLIRRASQTGRIMGPLVLPADSVTQAGGLAAEVGARPLDVSVVIHADNAADAIAAIEDDPHIELAAVELKINTDTDIAEVVHGVKALTDATVFVEVDIGQVDAGVLDQLAAVGAQAKFRTGGIEAHLFPSPAELARFIIAAVAAGVNFKLTAGLHEGIRFTKESTGFIHHGFVNIADAVTAVRAGAVSSEIETLLASTDTDWLLGKFNRADSGWRETFVSFGTCSIPEPLESLEALGLVPANLRTNIEKEEKIVSDTPATSAAAIYATPGFGVENLPYGSYSIGETDETGAENTRLGLRLGETVLSAADLGRIAGLPADLIGFLDAPNLDQLLTADRSTWDRIRASFIDFLRSDHSANAVASVTHPIDAVTMSLPFTVADYVDFYASEHHASNVGAIFRPEQDPLLPNWKHLPVGYNGRSGSVYVTGTDILRPKGLRPEPEGTPSFGPSRRLDIEAEMGFVAGHAAPHGEIPLPEAEDHIFGVMLLNDWSARDIQAYEYVPLGPFLGKSFATSISAWVTPLAAFDAARAATPVREKQLADYLDDSHLAPSGLEITVEVLIGTEVVATTPYSAMYYSPAQMLTHMTVNGAPLRPGDLFGSGTISGPERGQRGSFLELSWGGKEPLVLRDGSEMSFLEDGQTIGLRATAQTSHGTIISLGEVWGAILPAT